MLRRYGLLEPARRWSLLGTRRPIGVWRTWSWHTSERIIAVYISAKVDYAVRALCTLADADGEPVTAESLAKSQGLPAKFLESILNDMRRAGLLLSQRGAEGGYRLSRPAERSPWPT